MDALWQQMTVMVAIAVAALYLVVHYVRRKRRKTGCANCPTLKVLQDDPRLKRR